MEQISTSTQEEEKRFYCPYKWCSYSTLPPTSKLYTHIRARHPPGIRHLTTNCSLIFKSPLGQVINFDESTRDLLTNDEEISVENVSKGFYCPYKNCDASYDIEHNFYSHLRKKHRQRVPPLKLGSRLHTIRGPTGCILRFDEDSRDTLNEEDNILVENLNTIARTKAVMAHIRSAITFTSTFKSITTTSSRQIPKPEGGGN
ncbi:hypothetical protein BDB00DRAFT_641374 [Zychaea mexicana]|uniref:uncharacterized protein n=1 Tax=Zychaea mexicana TaxID=64656 RepID=UPI0022FF1076|nr:uncharacterized protein BDB00DRAFT_641374 [Zychaea mexicana]KAI9489061.1 hypothetical protein BDB00DRAFT_641374 [Zychaea mexicana]